MGTNGTRDIELFTPPPYYLRNFEKSANSTFEIRKMRVICRNIILHRRAERVSEKNQYYLQEHTI